MRFAPFAVLIAVLAGCSETPPPAPVAFADMCSDAYDGQRVAVTGYVGFPSTSFLSCTKRGDAPQRCDFVFTDAAGADTAWVEIVDGQGPNAVAIDEGEAPSLMSQIAVGAVRDQVEPDEGRAGSALLQDAGGTVRPIPTPAEIIGEVSYFSGTEEYEPVCKLVAEEVHWTAG